MRIATAAAVCLGFVGFSALSGGLGCTGAPKKKLLTPEEMVQMDPLPLHKGAKWTYNVTVKRFDPDADKETTHTLQWVTEVVGVTEGSGVTAYRVKGWPTDLESTADAAPPPASSGSAGAPGATPAAEPAPVATERTLLRSGNAFLWGATTEPVLDGAEGWFQWPVHDGEKICPSKQMAYCWLVSAVETGYALTFYTGPDEQTFELEPGTGVSRFHYAHHGTTNEIEAKLVSYEDGK
jgi:hypothetical protein